MTFTFSQPLKILAIGGSLITSSSFWFFNPTPAVGPVQARTPSQSSARVSLVDEDVNINTFDSAPKLTDLTITIKIDDRIKNPIVDSASNQFKFTHKDSNEVIGISYGSWQRIEDFKVANIMGKRSQYKEISREDIKIKLFKEHAWFSTINPQVDEYKDPLTTEEINDLFTGVDETKAKQLLLSLQKNIEWKFWYSSENINYYIGQIPFLSKVFSPEGLKDLKIKYFSEFKDLKDYVHKKVKGSCTNDNEACIAYPEELSFHKTDTKEYLNQ